MRGQALGLEAESGCCGVIFVEKRKSDEADRAKCGTASIR